VAAPCQGGPGRGWGLRDKCLPTWLTLSLPLEQVDGLMGLSRDRVLPFDIDAARRYGELAVKAKAGGRGFPTLDCYIAAIAASRGFIVASRDTGPYEAGGVTVINPWEA
jgi:predicted nucleic acid-binding protein